MAEKSSIFYGEGYDRQMANTVYDVLRKGVVCKYSDFMKEYLGEKWDPNVSVSSYKEYDSLKKAVKNVVDEIARVMGDAAILKKGDKRHRTFQYVGCDPDPLRLLQDSIPKGIAAYMEFCRDSAGFIPEEWIWHFLKNSITLYDIHRAKAQGTRGVVMSHSRELKNIEILPLIYEAIKNKTALRIEYAPYEGQPRVIWLSPHYLREFNGRWFVSGLVGRNRSDPYNVALDRITDFKPVDGQYREAPAQLYKEWFDDLIGISRYSGATLEDVVIRTHSAYIHGLVMTKPFHHSQTEIKSYGRHEDGEYGEIGLRILLNPGENKEFRGKLLTFGSELEVMAPERLRDELASEVIKLWKSYTK